MLARVLSTTVLTLTLVLSPAAAPPRATEGPTGWLGVLFGADEGTGGPAGPAGVRVKGVAESSPAEEARIRAKDLIVAVDGVPVSTPAQLMAQIQGLPPGSWAAITALRAGQNVDLRARLAPRPTGWRIRRGWIGVEAIELPPSLRAYFGAPESAGIMVSRVVPASPAEIAGIRVGDVIYAADGNPVASRGALSNLVTEAGIDNPIEIALTRYGAEIVVAPWVARLPDVIEAP